MEPLIYLTGSPPDPRSLELPETSPAMPTTPLPKTPSMALRALDSLRDSHLVPMSPRLEVSQPHTPKPDHEDERREAKADGDNPFPVDRNVLRIIIREKLGCEPSHIKFLSSGTFHKAFLVSLVDGPDVVARIARRYMPRLKTESEIATINYVRTYTNIPVPFIYAYDSDPYNKLGGEYIIMSKAPGVPLIRHFHSMPANKMHDLLKNLAEMLVPLSTHTFPAIGSLYQQGELCPPREVVRSILRRAKISGGDPGKIAAGMGYGRHNQRDSGKLTVDTLNVLHLHSRQMRPSPLHESAVLPPLPSPLSPVTSFTPSTAGPSTSTSGPKRSDFYVGPIVAWPFFGSGRGELPSVDRPTIPLSDSLANKAPEDPPPSPTVHDPDEIDRGPFPTFDSYTRACVRREVEGVRREQEKTGASHKPHLLPASEERGHHHHGHGHGHGHAAHHHSHGRRRVSDELHMLNPAPKRRRRVRSGLGALGSDGLGSNAPKNRRVSRGLGSLGNGQGPISSISSTSTPSLASSDSDSDSDSEGSCSCSDSGCSCSSGSGSSEESETVYSDEEAFYGDYRSAQRSSLFVGLNLAREGAVKAEMERWARWMAAQAHGDESGGEETAESSGSDESIKKSNGGIGTGGFVGVAPLLTSTPSKIRPVATPKVLSPPRGVGVGGGGFVGVGPAVPEPAQARSPSPPTSPVPKSRGRGVGVGGGGFVGVGPGPSYNTSSGTGFIGVGVGGGFLNVGGIPSPPEPSSPASPVSPTQGFAGGRAVGVGGGGFLSVAAPVSPPTIRGVGAGGFLSVGAPPEPPKPAEKRKKKAVKPKDHKDELGDFVLDLHDLSLANIFVDSVDSSKITCIIDWESTTIRPFWHAAHLPTFLVSATNAHSHPVTPRLQSTRISKGVSQADSRMSHQPDSRMSHQPDSRHSHRALGTLGNGHLPSSGAASGMATIAALTAALNDYAQGMNDAMFASPKYTTFGDSPRTHHFGDSSPRFPHSPQRRYATLGESPRLHTPPLHSDAILDSAPRTAVLSRQHLQHSNSYPSPHSRRSGPNTAVNTVSALRPGIAPRSISTRSDVHAHFEEAGREHDHEFKRHHDSSGGETPRRITREEAADWFKRIAAEIECPTGCGDKKERCGERWTRAERERASWRVAHKAVEWDGWELGLVESVLEDASTLQGDMDF